MILREIAGECILVPTGAAAAKLNGIISLNGSGRYLWELLREERTEAELTEALLAEYEVDRETAERDVRSFVGRLREAGALV